MPKISLTSISKSIREKNVKNLYYFYGDDVLLAKKIINKIFKLSDENLENISIFDKEKLDLTLLEQTIDTYPILGNKKNILITNLELSSMTKDFCEKFLDILRKIPEFCNLIIYNTLRKDDKKNLVYSKFLNELSKISDFLEFKCDSISSKKQAILWAKNFDKLLIEENAKILCNKCGNNLSLIRETMEKICITSDSPEISEQLINDFSVKKEIEQNVYNISKFIRAKDIKSAIEIYEKLVRSGEDPLRILYVISSDFIDALRVCEAEKSGVSIDDIPNFFDYKKKEFKLNYASNLKNKFDIHKVIDLLIKADKKIKLSSVDNYEAVRSFFISLMKI